MVFAANDPRAVLVTGCLFVLWAVAVGLWYVTRVFIPRWREEGFRQVWKHAAVVLSIVMTMATLGVLLVATR